MSATITIQTGAPGVVQPRVNQPDALSGETPSVSGGPALAAPTQARWYAVYTCANHEKRVADQFASRTVEHFLPQYESVRRGKTERCGCICRSFPATFLFIWLSKSDYAFCKSPE